VQGRRAHGAGERVPRLVIATSHWIDTFSVLPLRWSLSVPAAAGLPTIPDYGLSFTYDASLDLGPPDGVQAPDCVR
jgi:hypothetical protein